MILTMYAELGTMTREFGHESDESEKSEHSLLAFP